MITKIKDALYNNEDKLKDILEALEFEKIRKMGKCFKFSWGDGGASSGVANSLNIETLKFDSYSKNIHGDLLSLVSERQGVELGSAIKWLANYLGLNWSYTPKQEVYLPFNAFYLNFEKVQEESYTFKTYDESIVQEYVNQGLSLYWVREGISALTQEKFSIGYDSWSGRLTIPWRSITGEVLGIQGRLDKADCEEWESRYMPIIPFFKGNALYGLYENYKTIQDKGVVIVVESEKACLMAREIGYTNVVSVGCHNLTPHQIKLIKSLAVNVILAYDEDIPLEESIAQAKELIISNPFFSNEVYILDMSGLEKKSCIFDLGKDVVDKALEERLIYLG